MDSITTLGSHRPLTSTQQTTSTWSLVGLVVTVVPLVVIGLWSRLVLRMNFVQFGGLIAGAMTNPPALTFMNNLCRSDSPGPAYATVYPLATLLRIATAQVLALWFCSY